MKGHNGIVLIPRGSRRSALADERSGLLGKIVFELRGAHDGGDHACVR